MPKPNPKVQARKQRQMWPAYHLHKLFGLPATVDSSPAPAHVELRRALSSPSVVRSPMDTIDEESKAAPEVSEVFTCNTCKALFDTSQEQRAHFKSEWHHANLRRGLQGKGVLDEGESACLLDSADEDNDDEDDSSAAPSTAAVNRPKITITSDSHALSLWKVILPLESTLKDRETCSAPAACFCKPSDVWVVLAFRSGHFAAAVFQEGRCLVHKCFHRYTVRKKQGGAQSTRDNSGGGKPRSIGSSMRRANEVALRADIYGLMELWREHMDAATHIFLATTKSHLPMFYAEESYLRKDDDRVRKVPFITQRPTFGEAQRIYRELVSVKAVPVAKKSRSGLPLAPIVRSSPGAPVEMAGAGAGAPDSDASEGAGAGAGADASDDDSSDAASENHDMVLDMADELCSVGAAGNWESLMAVLAAVEEATSSTAEGSCDATRDLIATIVNTPMKGGRTALHCAAKSGTAAVVTELMLRGADPTIKDVGDKTPFMLASRSDVRSAFRHYRADAPDAWDYDAAAIPEPAAADYTSTAVAAAAADKPKKLSRKAKRRQAKRRKKEAAAAAEAAADDDEAALKQAMEHVDECRAEAKRRVEDIHGQQALAARVASLASTLSMTPDDLMLRVTQSVGASGAVEDVLGGFEEAALAGLTGRDLFGGM